MAADGKTNSGSQIVALVVHEVDEEHGREHEGLVLRLQRRPLGEVDDEVVGVERRLPAHPQPLLGDGGDGDAGRGRGHGEVHVGAVAEVAQGAANLFAQEEEAEKE